MKVIVYCRVSTADQADSGVSLDSQQSKCAAFAALYELEIVEVIVDAGESGKTLDRPGLERALGLLRAGKAEGLLVGSLNRLTRSVADWQTLIDGYFSEKAGKQLLSVADCVDTRSAAGRLVLNVLLSVSQWERETIAERTREALRYKISSRQRVGKVRFSFDLAPDGTTLVENPAEQGVIDLMRDLRAAGKTLRQIAKELTRQGVPTKERKPRWTHTAVAYILGRAA